MAGEFTQAQLDELTAKIAAGTVAIRHGDKSENTAALPEMIALRDRMIRELRGDRARRHGRHLARFDRGDR